ncbi:MAG: methyltransferase, partial [Terriglobia bacterium]
MTSRERVTLALNHKEADRVPLDLGGSGTTGMHVDSVYLLRQALGLDRPGTPVKVIDPFQMLGEVGPDLVAALDADVLPLEKQVTVFGFRLEGWKPWTTFAGTPVLVPAGFTTEPDSNGDILLYPQGDRSVGATARMPNGGIYFDMIVRQPT